MGNHDVSTTEWVTDPNEFLAVFRNNGADKPMVAVGIEFQAVPVTSSRARQELMMYASDLEAEVDALERVAAASRGSNEAECEAMMCRLEARVVRRDINRFDGRR
jgi:hypothetical protein